MNRVEPRIISCSHLAIALVGMLCVACGSEKSTPEPGAGASSATPAASAAGTSDTPAEAKQTLPDGFMKPHARVAATKNTVYIATDAALLSIENGAFVKIADLPKYFSPTDITLDSNGVVWILGSKAVAKLEGTSWQVYTLSDGNGALKHLAVHDENNIDVVGVYGISHFNGESWTLSKNQDLLGEKSGGIQDVMIDGKGRGYATAYNKLLYRETTTWTASDGSELYSAMDLAADGTLAITTSSGVLLSTGGKVKKVAVEGCTSPRGVYLRGDKFYLPCYGALNVVAQKSGATKTYSMKKGGDVDVGMLDAIDVDSSGRVYIGARSGLFVIASDGKVTSWKLGSVPLMATGPKAILAVGAGPETLPGKKEVKYGAVTGKLSKRQKPLGDVTIEICTNTSSLLRAGETPCSSASWKTSGKTASDGGFSFNKVPIGKLQFAYLPKGSAKWVLVLGFDCCANLQEGKTIDVGSLDML